MNQPFIEGFVKQALSNNLSAYQALTLLKEADVTGWLDQFLQNRYDDLRAGASHSANDAMGGAAGGIRDIFSAANPFGTGNPIDYFTNFGSRMDSSEQARRESKGNLFADIARNSATNGSLDRANAYGQMAQGEGAMLKNFGAVNDLGNSLNTTRNISSGIQQQTDRLAQESANNLSTAQNKLNTPFNLNLPKTPNPATPAPATNPTPSPISVSDSMRKPLFSLGDSSGRPNVKI